MPLHPTTPPPPDPPREPRDSRPAQIARDAARAIREWAPDPVNAAVGAAVAADMLAAEAASLAGEAEHYLSRTAPRTAHG